MMRGSGAARGNGFTLLEVVVASAIFAVLMTVSLSLLSSQVKLGKQQHTKAFGTAQVQRVYQELGTTLQSCVYEPTGTWPGKSDFYGASGDNFCRLRLYRVNKSQPYTLTPPFALDIDYPTPTVLIGVVDNANGWLAKNATTTGRLIYGLDTNADGTPEQIRVMADNVSKFVVKSTTQTGLLDLTIELTLKTGDSEKNLSASLEKPSASGKCLCSQYDATSMR